MINLTGVMSPNNYIDRTGIVVGVSVLGAIAIGGMVTGGIKSSQANKLAQENMQKTDDIARENLKFQKEQQVKLDAQKDVYRKMEFKNPYENMENVFEDLTVNQQQAQFEAQQGAQQRSNILQGLRGAAGGSGVAGLAQALAGQGQLATQRASASIAQQEAQNQKLALKGQQAADLQERGGEASVQSMEMDRQATLLGISMGESAGANAAAMQAQQNQIAAGATQANLQGQQAAAAYGVAGQAIGAGVGVATQGASDRRLKKNINLISKSPSGFNIYSFEYKNLKYGVGLFQGVMSDEIPQEAVETIDGYDMVDYSMLDVEFKQI